MFSFQFQIIYPFCNSVFHVELLVSKPEIDLTFETLHLTITEHAVIVQLKVGVFCSLYKKQNLLEH